MAGTVTQLMTKPTPAQVVVKFDWLAAAGGTLSAASTTANVDKEIRGLYCVCAITDPGATTKPTNNYDIAINDSFGCDIFGGELNNRASGSTEQTTPRVGNAYMARPIFTGLSVALTGNSVASASGALYVVFME